MNNFALSIIVILFLGNLLISFWVYADAKTKRLKPWLRIFFTILTLMNTSGLILYAILRNVFEQQANKVICPKCHELISNDVKFCPHCGVIHYPLEINRPVKSKKHFLFAGLSLLVIAIIIVIRMITTDVIPDNSSRYFHYFNTTMSVENKYGNTWNMRFKTANGIGTHTFKAKGEDWGLTYSSNITEGTIKFEVYDNAGNLVSEILPNTTDTLKNVENGEKYKLTVTAQKAKGAFSFKMVDLRP
jgi:hypothetical protein